MICLIALDWRITTTITSRNVLTLMTGEFFLHEVGTRFGEEKLSKL